MKSEKLSQLIQKPIKTPDKNLYQFMMSRPRFNACPVICRCHEKELRFDQLKKVSEDYAKVLAGLGVKKGNIVLICTEPSIEGVIMFFALNRLGAISTFMNSTANADELQTYIASYQAKILLLSKQCYDHLAQSKLLTRPGIKVFIISDGQGEDTHNPLFLSNMVATYANHSVELDVCSKNDAAHISYTSGTTGLPKAILLSNENIMAEMLSLLKVTKMPLGPKGNLMQVVPFNYPYGFIISVLLPICAGKTAALSPKLNLKNIGEYLGMYTPCYINGIPSFYKAMVADPSIGKMDLSFVRFPVTGGDTLDGKMEQEINAFFHSHGSKGKISNGCGNGEGCGSLLNPASVIHKYVAGSCGRPIPGLSVKLIDDEKEKPVPLGKSGRFCFSGANVMMEYYGDPENTDKAFHYDADGRKWFYTDTFMHMGNNSWMFMDGRERRFFITFDELGSPYKIYCDYVQKVIAETVPEIAECAVVQRPDETRSLVPVAFLCAKSVSQFDAESLQNIQSLCQQKLQRCAVPVEFIPIETLPLTVAGKVDYRALEREAAKER